MAMNYEIERHIKAAQEAGNSDVLPFLEGMKFQLDVLARNGIFHELSREVGGFQEQAATPKETTPVEIRRFSPEDRAALEAKGMVILVAQGSIASQKEEGRKFWSTWHKDYPEFEATPAMNSEVAIDPANLFIKGSNSKTLDQQLKMVEDYSKKISKDIPGVQAVMGDVSDYTSVAFSYLDATGERLFGEKYDYNYARTKTPTVESSVAFVGSFDAGRGLLVVNWRRGNVDGDIFAAPLVVPKA